MTMSGSLNVPVVKATSALLFYLLSNPPFLPTNVKSRELNKRHAILDSSPEDQESYLVTNCYPSQHASLPGEAIKLLRSMASRAETLSNASRRESISDLIHSIRFRVPEKDVISVAVSLGDAQRRQEPTSLTLLLRVEGPEDDESSYKYDNMVPSDALPGQWYDSIQDARKQSDMPANNLQVHHHTRNRGGSQSSSAMASTTSYETAVNHKGHGLKTPSNEYDDEEIQDGGEYFTDPKEFWAGVDDESGKDDRSEQHANPVEETAEERERREEEEERMYWARYDAHDSDISANRQQRQQVDGEIGGHRSMDLSADTTLRYTSSSGHANDTSTVRHGEVDDDSPSSKDRYLGNRVSCGTFGRAGDIAESEKQTLNLQRHSPDPESVTGQSAFDAPPHLSLSELEGHYRSRDLNQYADSRVQRMNRRHSGGAGLLPGIIEQGSETDANVVRAKDAIEALARAERQVAVIDHDEESKKQVTPRNASMDTLRKLAEANLIDGPQRVRDSSGPDANDSSRAGGFRNFLQMAPSVASDSDAGFQATSTTGMSLVRLPDTVEEDQISAEVDSTKEIFDIYDASVSRSDPSIPSSRLHPSECVHDEGNFRALPSRVHALDSPYDNEDEDPLMQQLKANILAGKPSRAAASASPLSSQPISGSFLPGAASDASMVALKSQADAPNMGLAKAGAGKASSDTSVEINSTSTDWERGNPTANRYSNLLHGGQTSQRVTVNRSAAIDQHLRLQKAEALQQHRKCVEQARLDNGNAQQGEQDVDIVQREHRPPADRLTTSSTIKALRGLPFADGQISLGGSQSGANRKALSDTSLAVADPNDLDDVILPPLSAAHEASVSVSPANATLGKVSAEGLTRDFAYRDGTANSLSATRLYGPAIPNAAHANSQQARADEALHTRRRREYAQGIKRRNESVKMMMKGAWLLMDETAAAFEGSQAGDGVERLDETEFLRIAREAVRECIAEKRNSFR